VSELKKIGEGFRKNGGDDTHMLSDGFKNFIGLLIEEIVREDLQKLTRDGGKCLEQKTIN
jgi:hypothetical protein